MPNNNNPFSDIPTESPINKASMEGQNKLLYEHLEAGGTISFLQARSLGIANLAVRISILRNAGITVYEREIRISNIQCAEYSLHPFE